MGTALRLTASSTPVTTLRAFWRRWRLTAAREDVCGIKMAGAQEKCAWSKKFFRKPRKIFVEPRKFFRKPIKKYRVPRKNLHGPIDTRYIRIYNIQSKMYIPSLVRINEELLSGKNPTIVRSF